MDFWSLLVLRKSLVFPYRFKNGALNIVIVKLRLTVGLYFFVVLFFRILFLFRVSPPLAHLPPFLCLIFLTPPLTTAAPKCYLLFHTFTTRGGRMSKVGGRRMGIKRWMERGGGNWGTLGGVKKCWILFLKWIRCE